jgi:hypothetical protein
MTGKRKKPARKRKQRIRVQRQVTAGAAMMNRYPDVFAALAK